MKYLLHLARVTEDADQVATRREDGLTIVFTLWLVVGLFLDGFAHENLLEEGESFITPWHAVFYAGFLATSVWVWTIAHRYRDRGSETLRVPRGYGAMVLGLIVFAIGGIGDGLWHTIWGVETGIDGLLSPTHLLLFGGLVLLVSTPLRASTNRSVPAFTGFAPLVSAGLSLALVGFFLNFAWGLGIHELTKTSYDPVTASGEPEVIAGVASTLVTTMVLFVFAVWLLARLHPPIGTFAGMFFAVALLVTLGFDEGWFGPPAAAVGGFVLDVGTRSIARTKRQPMMAAASATLALWATYFALLTVTGEVAWSHEIWLGAVVLNVMLAVVIAGAMQPRSDGGPGELEVDLHPAAAGN